MNDRRSSKQGVLAPYAGRWVAMIRGRVVAQGGTPEQARQAAQSRYKETPQLMYVPAQTFAFSPLLEQIAAALPADLPVYMVGGAVRDALLGRASHDWDFALPQDALNIARRVANHIGAAYFPLDEERATARLILVDENGSRMNLDFAGMRGATLEDDLRARDFTVNAMAVEIRHPQELLDPLGGAADLQAKTLRACSPSSMDADPIRVLRGVRQAAAFGFKIHPGTRSLMKSAVPGLSRISPERLRDELFRILGGVQPDTCMRALEMLGALPYVLPELVALKGVSQSAPHVWDVWEHTLAVLHQLNLVLSVLAPGYNPEKSASLGMGLMTLRLGRYRQKLDEHLSTPLNTDRSLRPLLFLAALYHDVEKPNTRSTDAAGNIHFYGHDERGAEIASQRGHGLRLSNPEIERLKLVVRHHMRPFQLAQAESLTPRAVYRYFRSCGPAGVDICLLSLADFLATYGATLPQETWAAHLDVLRDLLEAWWERPQQAVTPPPVINGHDLIEHFHLPPGPQIGELLEMVREAQVVGQVSRREEAVEFVKQKLEETTGKDRAAE